MAAPPPPPSSRPVGRLTTQEYGEGSYEGEERYEEGGYEGGEFNEYEEGGYEEGEYEEGEYAEGEYAEGGYGEEEEAETTTKAKKKPFRPPPRKERKKLIVVEKDQALWTCWWEGPWNNAWWEGNGWQQKKAPPPRVEEVEESPEQRCYDAPRDTWVTGVDLTKAKQQFLDFEEEQTEVVSNDISLEGTKVAEKYTIQGNLAKIGPSVLKEAVAKAGNKKVTLKVSGFVLDEMFVVPPHRNETSFFQEFSSKHPSLPRVVESFEIDENTFVTVFENVLRGKDLLTWLSGVGNAVSENSVRSILRGILTATSALHKSGIMHRSLFPSNILISDQNEPFLLDAKQTIKLADYKAMTGNPWTINPNCQPPEVVLRQDYSMKGDVWVIGVLACVLLSGSPPFFDKNSLRLSKKIRDGDLGSFLPRLPNDSSRDFVSKLLSKNENRPTAEEALAHPWLSSKEDSSFDLSQSLQETIDYLY
mmetsp:Transcript_9425/g.12688  ORF Transcript_9425/g.12688 Transcript_9425/m.12688 type:complete len:475 (+) Transcript_9425:58-1482(+)|eukprot:CAMPEP_0201487576 /NCGR_PEP_ID=MMETSP0151_2-20130828/13873_1 /ASSEMBLY_ACC=CAM_ASM_000257 /TAXON_ID=200890 /ORGANISM="Paramoeba atlantica, Strain 621/1 / CCAP 1560/9" /LENGTH=474 /DNA_ID=CAMNT_0047872651 /DNA_START=38 /DNA_END=1462 /DNA_ORIENTATION=+